MTALRQEIYNYINDIPESKLLALKPLLSVLANDSIVVEADLTADERLLISEGMAMYEANPHSFVPLANVN